MSKPSSIMARFITDFMEVSTRRVEDAFNCFVFISQFLSLVASRLEYWSKGLSPEVFTKYLILVFVVLANFSARPSPLVFKYSSSAYEIVGAR